MGVKMKPRNYVFSVMIICMVITTLAGLFDYSFWQIFMLSLVLFLLWLFSCNLEWKKEKDYSRGLNNLEKNP